MKKIDTYNLDRYQEVALVRITNWLHNKRNINQSVFDSLSRIYHRGTYTGDEQDLLNYWRDVYLKDNK